MITTRMRRALASILLAAVGFPMMGGLIPSDPESKLPTCCRRGGRHQCEMTPHSEDSAGPGMTAPARCASWPKAEARFRNIETAAPVGGFRSGAPISTWTAYKSTHFVFCGRATDSVHKRGPPAGLD